jgi:hypothetical protein
MMTYLSEVKLANKIIGKYINLAIFKDKLYDQLSEADIMMRLRSLESKPCCTFTPWVGYFTCLNLTTDAYLRLSPQIEGSDRFHSNSQVS